MTLTLLDRYIARNIVFSTLLVLGVLVAMFVLVVLVDALGDFGKGQFGVYQLVRYVVLSQPRRIYELFPTAVLIGTLLGLSTLALSSELTAMRAAGVSSARIVGAALKVGVVFMVVTMLIGEFVVPRAENLAELGRAKALAKGVRQANTGIWLRDERSFVNIREVLPDLSLLGVTIYEFDPAGRLVRQTAAEKSRHEGGTWQLRDVRETAFNEATVTSHNGDAQTWHTALTPEVMAVFAIKPEGLSLLHLYRYVRHLRHNGQDTGQYRLVFWQKALLPLATMAMVLLAAPFVFRHTRGGGLSQRIFLGVVLGLAFVVLGRAFGYFGLLYGLSPLAGAALPILLFLALALYLLRRAG